jgi:hypothetical protein
VRTFGAELVNEGIKAVLLLQTVEARAASCLGRQPVQQWKRVLWRRAASCSGGVWMGI